MSYLVFSLLELSLTLGHKAFSPVSSRYDSKSRGGLRIHPSVFLNVRTSFCLTWFMSPSPACGLHSLCLLVPRWLSRRVRMGWGIKHGLPRIVSRQGSYTGLIFCFLWLLLGFPPPMEYCSTWVTPLVAETVPKRWTKSLLLLYLSPPLYFQMSVY